RRNFANRPDGRRFLMVRARRILTSFGIVLSAAALAAGCGGAPEAATPTPAPATPAPAPDPSGSTVAATTATDANGQPINATGLGAAATVPNLAGDDVKGGVTGADNTNVFAAGAVSGDDAAGAPADTTTPPASETAGTGAGPTTTGSTTSPKPEALALTGAVIYVNGKTYSVTTNGTFPMGSPVFRLVSVDAGSIEVSLLAGEFTGDHSSGLILDKGDLKSLVDASANLTYKVKYLRGIVDTSGQGF
ncbi:MAG: hypothetical protein JWN41_775, partial [Thermoleophilia bacterium]|nr:hypothetical protein [Thermoleophilia bacterium]